MFFSDGSREYSEIELENTRDGKRYFVKLNPYVPVPEISE